MSALDAARERLSTDEFVDADGPTVHLPAFIADALLEDRGFHVVRYGVGVVLVEGGTVRPGDFAYVLAPDGEKLWHRDEALKLALVADVIERTCATCHGDGEVERSRTTDPQDAEPTPCPSCYGSGKRRNTGKRRHTAPA